MDAFDLVSHIHDRMDYIARDEDSDVALGREPGFKTWPELDEDEVEQVGRSLAALFGITLDT